MAARYKSYNTRSSISSDQSSSMELKSSSSKAIVKSKPLEPRNPKLDHNFSAMVKRFVDKKSTTSKRMELMIPSDVISEDLKKTARKGAGGAGFSALQRKLFGEKEKKNVKALTLVNENTRTLAMVLRSERELLSSNKDHEIEINRLKSLLEQKNNEVEKLKDLCLKQREEIKGLKDAILFPDVMNLQIHEVLEKQGSELKQAKQLIPNLQRQVTSLTGQLQCIAEDLAEVKADKYSVKSYPQHHGSSPRTLSFDHDDASNSLVFSSSDTAFPDSPDDMLLRDLNPCLTPFSAKTKSKEFGETGYDSPEETSFTQKLDQVGYSSCSRKLSKSSDCCRGRGKPRTTTRRSDENKVSSRQQMHRTYF